MKRKHISGYSIFQYWAGKKDYNGFDWIPDHNQKTCFKCRKLDSEKGENESLSHFWSRSTRLEKAHIVPHSFGGTEEPQNIMFLCARCHAESPDTVDYEANLKWISDNRIDYTYNIIMSVFASLTEEEKELACDISKDHLKDALMKKVGLHGFSVSDSSIQLVLLQTVKEYAAKMKNCTQA